MKLKHIFEKKISKEEIKKEIEEQKKLLLKHAVSFKTPQQEKAHAFHEVCKIKHAINVLSKFLMLILILSSCEIDQYKNMCMIKEQVDNWNMIDQKEYIFRIETTYKIDCIILELESKNGSIPYNIKVSMSGSYVILASTETDPEFKSVSGKVLVNLVY